MNVWFSSDHHFGHANIIRFCDRPWIKPGPAFATEIEEAHWLANNEPEPDVEAMNEALITYWNETVSPGDKVFYVGDFALGPRTTVGAIAPRLHGELHLITGNHDRCWLGKKGGSENEAMYFDAGFVSITKEMEFEGYLVNHFPYTVDFRRNGEDKFSGFRPWRKDHVGVKLIHGHVHDAWKIKDDQINVGVDVWGFEPVNFDTIREELPA